MTQTVEMTWSFAKNEWRKAAIKHVGMVSPVTKKNLRLQNSGMQEITTEMRE